MGELKVSSLSDEQMEKMCEIAEEAARRSIASRVPGRGISDLTVSVDLKGAETLDIEVEVELTLLPSFRNVNAKQIAEDSVKAAFEAVERHMRGRLDAH